VRRRQLILGLSIISIALTLGLAFAQNFVTFQVVSFFLGIVTCVPQIFMPLTGDLAPPERRGTALSITTSGLLLGVLYARVVAGLIANFVSWRVVYYVAIGLMSGVLVLLYFTLPDYPTKNKGLTYFNILLTMAKFAATELILVQAALVSFVSMACFTNFWVRTYTCFNLLSILLTYQPGYFNLPSRRAPIQLFHPCDRSRWSCWCVRCRGRALHRPLY
jgi:MFS family permease